MMMMLIIEIIVAISILLFDIKTVNEEILHCCGIGAIYQEVHSTNVHF